MNYGTFLVRITDGAVFKGSNLPFSFPDPTTFPRSDLFIQYDMYGNIYYIHNQKVYKLNVTNPDNLTLSTYSAGSDQVNFFVLDKYGNMTYMYGGGNRFKYASGQLVNIPYAFEYSDVNGDFIYGRNNDNGTLNIVRIIPDPFAIVNYGDPSFTLNGLSHLVKLKNKNVVIGEGAGFVFEVFNISGNPVKYPVTHFDASFGEAAIKNLFSSPNYYYILAKNNMLQSVLLKVDPATGHTPQNLVTTGQYDIYYVIVNDADEVQFYALRMSDGKRVLAEINSSGIVNVLAELDDDMVIALERLN